MSLPPVQPRRPKDPPAIPPEAMPNYDLIVTDDGEPVDGMYSERQMRLLTDPLYASWPGPGAGRPFLATANVGLFYAMNEPPVVPDVMLSLDVGVRDLRQKKNRSYFVWEYGKLPEVVIEIVSNREGEELGRRREIYTRIGVSYYLVWDPEGFLGDRRFYSWMRHGSGYVENGTWLRDVGLGVAEWEGTFEGWDDVWLRWCDAHGQVLPTGTERADQEQQRADEAQQRADLERQRADQERERAERLAAQLRALGIDPNGHHEP